jgi:hypothetical protein
MCQKALNFGQLVSAGLTALRAFRLKDRINLINRRPYRNRSLAAIANDAGIFFAWNGFVGHGFNS